MPEARVANSYAFQDDLAEVALSVGLDGAPIASVSLDGQPILHVEVADHHTHWMLTCVSESIPDLKESTAYVRIPVVNLTSGGREPVTALLSIITSHTNFAGEAGVTGPLETYQTRLLEGEASEIQTITGERAVHEYGEITAICDHEPGSEEPRRLNVHGVVVFRQGGWKVDVRPASGNTGPIAEHLTLELVFSHSGGPSTDPLDPVEFEYVRDTEGIEYQQVSFRVIGTSDEPPPPVTVIHPV